MAARGRSLSHARLRVGYCLSANSRIYPRLGRFPASFRRSAAVSDTARKTESDHRVLSRGPRVLGGRFHDRPPYGPVDLGSPLTHLSIFFFSRPQLGRDDPLNLSILLRGGKENNDDSLSKGD